MSWTPSLLLLLIGVLIGPYGLNLLSPLVLALVDPIVAMALAMVGVFVGLGVDPQRPRIDPALALIIAGGIALAAFRSPSLAPLALTTLALAGIAIVIGLAGWLLVGQTNSEREQHVFVVGTLLLLGGTAAYLSLSALFAGLLAGLVWNAAGNLARARIVKDLRYLQHPLIVLLLLVAGASVVASVEALVLAAIVVGLQVAVRSPTDPGSFSYSLIAVALALDVFRGSFK